MNVIDELREKYASHDYMKQKVEDYLIHLPLLMKTIEEEYDRRQIKKQELFKLRDEYITEFIKSFTFFYIPQTELYVEYIDQQYVTVTEDYIIHLIGTKLTKSLFASKHKIIPAILKRIKDNLFIQTSNSYITKMVIPLLPFQKERSKYFLTLLGDIILNKRDASTICYLDNSYKPFLKSMNQNLYLMINKSIDIFKHKYYDHKYEMCRVITGTCTDFQPVPILHVIVAAVTLSVKYGGSEGFIAQSQDQEFVHGITLLKTNTPETLIQLFLSSMMIRDPMASIPYRDVYFLWKTFLRSHSLPFVVSQQNFKSSLLQQLGACDGDLLHLSTTLQTHLLKFKHFWDNYMVQDDEQSYELQEIVDIYNKHEKATITIDIMKEVLMVEYPTIIIEKTNVMGIKCLLWNKNMEIENAMDMFKHTDINLPESDELYGIYCNYAKQQHKRVVTREYFDKVI